MDAAAARVRALVETAANNEGPPVIVLFGPPGSGKGTQARLLQERFAWPHVSTGDMLRAHIAAKDTIGQAMESLMRSGRLVPDELVDGMVAQRVMEPDCNGGVILDGFPRTVQQAREPRHWAPPSEMARINCTASARRRVLTSIRMFRI